ncbi:histidinol dehydrogenase [Vulcanisaeta souniana]|uniref:histidinol dehydrogenase n=1 Tax=Vulcanisaeta souniana TaxID=164452 RepID=UPI001FB43515|nr:histidinol dehydrogenase [Vulcanisaeta souniana]
MSPLRLSRESLLGEFRRMRSLDKYVDAVRAIINDVRTRGGDEAVIAYTERFDSVTLTKIEVDVDELRELASRVNKDVAQAIDEAYKSVEGFNRKLMPSDFEEEYCGLIRGGVKWVPLIGLGFTCQGLLLDSHNDGCHSQGCRRWRVGNNYTAE